MAHYAELDNSNKVKRIVVIDNSKEPTEAEGQAFCQQLFKGGVWRKTSFNGNIRKNFAGVGYIYDAPRDAFIAPRPYASWILDEDSCQWKAPVERPEGLNYQWSELTKSWVIPAV